MGGREDNIYGVNSKQLVKGLKMPFMPMISTRPQVVVEIFERGRMYCNRRLRKRL